MRECLIDAVIAPSAGAVVSVGEVQERVLIPHPEL